MTLPDLTARVRERVAQGGLGVQLLQAVVGSAGVRLIGMAFAFLVGVQLARTLGAEGYGLYGVALSAISLLTVPTEFGLPQLLMREVASSQVNGDWGRLHGVLRWSDRSVAIASATITLLGLVCIGLGPGFESELFGPLAAGLILVPLVALGNLRAASLRGLQHIIAGQIPESVVRPALFSLLLFVGSSLGARIDAATAMLMSAVAAGVALLLAALALRRALPPAVRTAPPLVQSRAWWSTAFPMALTEGMRVLQGHLMILVLGAVAAAATVGIFRVASSLAMLISTPVTLLNVVVAPVIARLHAQGDHERLQRLVSWTAAGMTVTTSVLTAVLVLTGEGPLGAVFGPEFQDSYVPLVVLSVGIVASSVFGASASLLNMTRHASWVTRASVVSVAVLVVLSAPLVVVAGSVGAAIATSVALLVWNMIMWYKARSLLQIDATFLPLLFRRSPRHAV